MPKQFKALDKEYLDLLQQGCVSTILHGPEIKEQIRILFKQEQELSAQRSREALQHQKVQRK